MRYIFIFFTFITFNVLSKEIELTVPAISDQPKQQQYFHELLTTALENDGHTLKLNTFHVPHLRAKKYLKSGKISILWMLKTKQRDKDYIAVNINLTEGMIGKRILLIKKTEQTRFDKIKNLEALQQSNLVAGLGDDWFDTEVWENNNLKYETYTGNWKAIFKMLSRRKIYDYFPRGIHEVIDNSQSYPELMIEKNLVLIYKRDMIFYLSKKDLKYKKVIESAIKNAKNSGLIKKLVDKYWALNSYKLNYDKRTKIMLELP